MLFTLPRALLSLSRRLGLFALALHLLAALCPAHIPHGNHGNGVVNTGARGRYSADNLDGAQAFQASDGYAQAQSYKDMLRRDYVRGIVDSVIAQEGGQQKAFTAAEKQALVRLLQSEDHAKRLSSHKIASIARGALVVAEGADNLEAGGSSRLHALLDGRGIADNGGSVLNPQSPAELLTALAQKGEEPAYGGRVPAHHRYAWEDTDGDGVSNQDEWDLNTDPDDIFHAPTAAELAELERQRIEAAKTFAERQAERQAAEAERLRLEAEAWQLTLEAEHEAQREYELCHPELARQGTDRMLTENFTPIVKVDENGRPLMLVRRTGPDGQEVDVWATPKDLELADNFVQNSAGEWELRGEQERHRKFTNERFVSDYLAPAMRRAESSLDAFVEVNLTAASIVAGGAGVTGAAPRLIAMSKEALSEFTGLPVGFKDIKQLFSRKALGQVDEAAGRLDFTKATGALGGELYSAPKLTRLEGYLGRRGVTLKVGDEFLPPGKGGGFAIDGSELILPSNPTNYVVWHELSHFRQFQKLGKEAYMALLRSKTFHAPEQFVFDMLENSPKRWNALNFSEQQHAIRYIEAVGGFR